MIIGAEEVYVYEGWPLELACPPYAMLNEYARDMQYGMMDDTDGDYGEYTVDGEDGASGDDADGSFPYEVVFEIIITFLAGLYV